MTKVIRISERGSLTLPRQAREKLGVTHGGQILAEIQEGGEVVLRAQGAMPVEIYSPARIVEFRRVNELPLACKKLRWRRAR